MSNIGINTPLLAAQMYSTGHITQEQEEHILREEKPRDRAAQLVICVLRNQCTDAFICSMKEISALNYIATKIEERNKLFGE